MSNIHIDLNDIHERELHPFLVRYLAKKMNIYTKTIFHEVSTKLGKGKSEWLHPDIVGFNLPVENWDEKVLELCGNFSINRATIYSFELKKTITIETLREQFFQAVSNSSWANEGYLVGVDINTDDIEPMQEIKRLSSAFNIGIIKLNLINVEDSEILIQPRRKEKLDGETINKLFSINKNFKDFVRVVLHSIKINQVVHNGLDKVVSEKELNDILDVDRPEGIKDEGENSPSTDINSECLGLDSDFTGKSPNCIEIESNKITVSFWKDIYIKVCEYLIDRDKEKFIKVAMDIRGKKRLYFARESSTMKAPYYLSEVDLYLEINLNANSIMGIVKKLLIGYEINESEVKIYVNKNNI